MGVPWWRRNTTPTEKGCDSASSIRIQVSCFGECHPLKLLGEGFWACAHRSLVPPPITEPEPTPTPVFLFIPTQLRSHSDGERKLELNETETQSPGSMTAHEHYWQFYVSTAWDAGWGPPTSATRNRADLCTGQTSGSPEAGLC